MKIKSVFISIVALIVFLIITIIVSETMENRRSEIRIIKGGVWVK